MSVFLCDINYRAQVRRDWQQSYQHLVPIICKLKLVLKELQRTGKPIDAVVLRLAVARTNLANLLATRAAIKQAAVTLRELKALSAVEPAKSRNFRVGSLAAVPTQQANC